MPEPYGMPLSISISKPNGSWSSLRSAINAAPAVFNSASNGSSAMLPRIALMRTTGAEAGAP